MRIKSSVTTLHFFLLGILILNFIIGEISGTSLIFSLSQFLVHLLFGIGIVLFIWNLKPIKATVVYYGLYFLSFIIPILFYLFGGLFLAIISSIVLTPIYPLEVKAKSENFKVYEEFHGFLGPCCSYQVTKTKFWLLEEKIGEINVDEQINISDLSTPKNDQLSISWTNTYANDQENDSTITFFTK